jgi:vacuolar-type H+-ATPase subunit E/Vma4
MLNKQLFKIMVFYLAASIIGISNAIAYTCDMLSFNVDEARSKLKRATNETDLESAKDAARRAKNALEEAAYSARDCGCDTAAMEFDSAATKARRARDASNADEFVDELNRAIRSYNSAIDFLRLCRPKKD